MLPKALTIHNIARQRRPRSLSWHTTCIMCHDSEGAKVAIKLLLSVVSKMSSVRLASHCHDVYLVQSAHCQSSYALVKHAHRSWPDPTWPRREPRRFWHAHVIACCHFYTLVTPRTSHTHTDTINGVSSSLRNLELIYSNPLVSPSVRTSLNIYIFIHHNW